MEFEVSERITPSNLRTIVVIGDTFCDIIAVNAQLIESWGTDTLAKEIRVFAGGSALNIAVHGASFSAQFNKQVNICFLSSTGADFQGQICRDALCIANLDSSKIVIDRNCRTGSCIVISGAEDRSFITDRGCIRDLSIGWFKEEDYISNCVGHLHVGGFYNCDKLKNEAVELFQSARALKKTTSLNPQHDAEGKWDGIKELCPHLTIFVANEAELIKVSKSPEGSPTLDQAKVLLDWGCTIVVVTRGSEGARAYRINDCCSEGVLNHGDVECHSQAAATVAVTDATGAGDAFTGGFLVEWIATADIPSSLRAGCIAGGAAVTQVGGSTCSSIALEESERNYPVESLT
jgi:ribokinase